MAVIQNSLKDYEKGHRHWKNHRLLPSLGNLDFSIHKIEISAGMSAGFRVTDIYYLRWLYEQKTNQLSCQVFTIFSDYMITNKTKIYDMVPLPDSSQQSLQKQL